MSEEEIQNKLDLSHSFPEDEEVNPAEISSLLEASAPADLDLSSNGLRALPALPAALFPSLRALRLRGNRLGLGPPGALSALSSLSGLQVLDLSHNHLDGCDFPFPPGLRDLDLSGNRLRDMPRGFAAAAPLLRRLDLSDNALDAPLALFDEFPRLPALAALSLRGNAIAELPAHFLLPPALERWDMRGNGRRFLGFSALARAFAAREDCELLMDEDQDEKDERGDDALLRKSSAKTRKQPDEAPAARLQSFDDELNDHPFLAALRSSTQRELLRRVLGEGLTLFLPLKRAWGPKRVARADLEAHLARMDPRPEGTQHAFTLLSRNRGAVDLLTREHVHVAGMGKRVRILHAWGRLQWTKVESGEKAVVPIFIVAKPFPRAPETAPEPAKKQEARTTASSLSSSMPSSMPSSNKAEITGDFYHICDLNPEEVTEHPDFAPFLEMVDSKAFSRLRSHLDSWSRGFHRRRPAGFDGLRDSIHESIRKGFDLLRLARESADASPTTTTMPMALQFAALQELAFRRVYASLFHQESEIERDSMLSERITRLQFLTPPMIGISKPPPTREWCQAERELLRLTSFASPTEKLRCILNACRLVMRGLGEVGGGRGVVVGADDFLPHLVMVFVRANPAHILFHMQFISRFAWEGLLTGERLYLFTQAMSVVSFVENLESSHLNMPEGTSYQALLYEGEWDRSPVAFAEAEREREREAPSRSLSSSMARLPPLSASSSSSSSGAVALDAESEPAPLGMALQASMKPVTEEDMARLREEYHFIDTRQHELRVADCPLLLREYQALFRRTMAGSPSVVVRDAERASNAPGVLVRAVDSLDALRRAVREKFAQLDPDVTEVRRMVRADAGTDLVEDEDVLELFLLPRPPGLFVFFARGAVAEEEKVNVPEETEKPEK